MAVIERAVTIVNPLGVHARPAAEFVKVANRFRANIEARKDDLTVNGKSIMGVMMLAAEYGAQVLLRTEGEDAVEAMDALTALVASGFNEMEIPGESDEIDEPEQTA